jgi:hypothetical protein
LTIGVDERVVRGLAPAPAVETGLLLAIPLPLVLQAARENASKQSRLRAMSQLFRCHKKFFIEFSLLIDFIEL